MQYAVLPKSQEGFEKVLTDREAQDQLLPWEERSIEKPCKALVTEQISDRGSTKDNGTGTYLKKIHRDSSFVSYGKSRQLRRSTVYAVVLVSDFGKEKREGEGGEG